MTNSREHLECNNACMLHSDRGRNMKKPSIQISQNLYEEQLYTLLVAVETSKPLLGKVCKIDLAPPSTIAATIVVGPAPAAS